MNRRIASSFVALTLMFVTFGAQAQEEGDDEGGMSTDAPAASSQSSQTGPMGQDGGTNSLESGNVSLSFTFPGGGNPYAGGTAGVWYMLSDQINLGINLGLGIDSTTEVANFDTDNEETTTRTGFDILLAPALRYYLMQDSQVSPYILGQLNFHKYFDGDNDTSADPTDDNYNSELQPELALVGGFGLEWFPIEQFSIGGHVGLGIDLLRQDQGSGAQGSTLTRNGLRIGTFTSALTANIYF